MVIPGKQEENLCVKAYQLLKKDFDIPFANVHLPVEIYLHKIIPTGAGLGGGSSNAAYTLRLLNTIFDLQLDTEQLKRYASRLGSDCSFFIEDKPMIGTGRGEVLHEAHVNLKGKFIVLVKPDLHVSTAEAYAGVQPDSNQLSIGEIVEKKPLTEWRAVLKNNFEESVFRKYPVIAGIKENLYQRGAVYASMSGSGSAVYGIFDQVVDLKNQFQGMVCWSGTLN